ncbi:methylmalonyl-CoA mutase family protein [Telluribacter sp. SYSU D00476]|uniref:methylmalonyl-CoA mutase family protein n=1 Tax=Telluribacter sp. SYSU D00476 TaxID=2811430 RepID=UPI001FF112D4|nr:methylmalonyl-CoA mutase family protein [Telluribacter sp. SYSU D00476]
MKESLFSSFKPTSKEDWLSQVEKDLGGTPYADLQWKVTGSIAMEPYYTAPEVADPRVADIQRCQKRQPGWLTQPVVYFTTPKDTNTQIHKALSAGADAVWLQVRGQQRVGTDLHKTLHNIRLTDTPVVFEVEGNVADLTHELLQVSGYHLKGGMAADAVASWMLTGQDYRPAVDQLAAVVARTNDMPAFRPLMVSGHAYHEAGAHVVQELACTLASAVWYLDQLTEAGLSARQVVSKLYFSLSIGSDYLTEIAKLRALRYLYRRVTDAYGLPAEAAPAYIHARNSAFYDAPVTPHTNMLRATSEAMSATVGGCDALTIHAYDATYRQSSSFSERIARNVSLILKEEGYMDKVADPAAGAHFIETLTLQLADEAWTLFQRIEQDGGIVAAFEKGWIQSEIEKEWNAKTEALTNGKVMVGVNRYRVEEPGERAEVPVPVASTQTLAELPAGFPLLVKRQLAAAIA